MNNIPEAQLIKDASIETGIDPAFIEKDWYSVQLLKSISEFSKFDNVQIVLSGGTSLSKGFGLIKRFSEDLDFILVAPEGFSVGDRRNFRKQLISHSKTLGNLTIDDGMIQKGDSHRFFKAPLQFEMAFAHNSLRNYLQLEMTFTPNRLDPVTCNIQSVIGFLSGQQPETQIPCLSPVETAANKFSAFTWRIFVRDRNSENDDPTVIRHLHDLAALYPTIQENNSDFFEWSLFLLANDMRKRGGGKMIPMHPEELMDNAVSLLTDDKQYQEEYRKFVQLMSYADDDEQILFNQAYESFCEMVQLCKYAM